MIPSRGIAVRKTDHTRAIGPQVAAGVDQGLGAIGIVAQDLWQWITSDGQGLAIGIADQVAIAVIGHHLIGFVASAATIDLNSLQLNGDAKFENDEIDLTEAVNGQAGSAYQKNAFTIPNNFEFSVEFEFGISKTGSGADGISFIIQNADFGDPNGNHVGINLQVNTQSAHIAITSIALEQNKQSRFAFIDYVNGTVDVRRSQANARPITFLLSESIDLSFLEEQAFFGFASATGGLNSAHVIKGFSLETNASVAPVPLPAPILLLGAAVLGLDGMRAAKKRASA
nr:L-type lectin-domain containing protein [Actibacterium sp. 188UL27-1]